MVFLPGAKRNLLTSPSLDVPPKAATSHSSSTLNLHLYERAITRMRAAAAYEDQGPKARDLR